MIGRAADQVAISGANLAANPRRAGRDCTAADRTQSRGVRAGFAEVLGLDVSVEVIEYRNGNEPIHVRKLPGLTKYSDVTLKRGVTGDLAFWEWIRTAMNRRVERRNVVVRLLDEAREPVLQWRLRRAWPCKYEGPSLGAKAGEIAMETLVISHEGLELE